jgi:cation transport protein ChaC
MAASFEPQSAGGWVFGYGSLMWNPGFVFQERHKATLDGYHRAFCVYSHHYRGNAERPGLVLGLAEGGSCRGVAFRVAADDWAEVVAYLDERELIGYAYRPARLNVRLDDGTEVEVHTYVADRGHPHFAGRLDDDTAAALIGQAVGVSGSNRDYAAKLVRELESHGFHDDHLALLLARIGA